MTLSNPTWAVVATVDEHPSLVRAFVAWHLSLGAQAIYLYFDRPDDPAADMFDDIAQVHVVRCDTAYWNSLGKRRPEKHQIRQCRNADHAFHRTDAAWLLHSDADEYLWPTLSVADHLSQLTSPSEGGVVRVAERRFLEGDPRPHIFAGVFQRPHDQRIESAPFTRRGMTGHAIGKSFVRVGANLEMSIHRPQRDDPPVNMAPVDGLTLLHFDGLTALQWIYKLLRKADAVANHNGAAPTAHRQQQIDAVLDNLRGARALHDRLKVLTPQQADALRADSLLLDIAFDPSTALAAVFGRAALLDPVEFDAWLMAEKSDVLSQLTSMT